jgi:chemotaxis signal transduction protein
LLEAVNVYQINSLPGVKPYIVGSIMYCDKSQNSNNGSNTPIIVIDGRILTNQPLDPDRLENNTGALIVVRSNKGIIGILVDGLDAIPTFEKNQIQAVTGLLSGDGGYVKALVNIPESNGQGKILIILDQDLNLAAARKR